MKHSIDKDERADEPSALPPVWKNDFPVRQSDEHRVTRRQFAKFACCSAVALGVGMVAKGKLLSESAPTAPKLVARVEELKVGGYKLFRYPTEDYPCILVRLAENQFVAYSQNCTHLMCPVNYQPESKQFYCPCHEGFFSAEDGRVMAGPPPRALPRYSVEIRAQEIWIGLPPEHLAKAKTLTKTRT